MQARDTNVLASPPLLEICVDIHRAASAARGRADRIELCGELAADVPPLGDPVTIPFGPQPASN